VFEDLVEATTTPEDDSEEALTRRVSRAGGAYICKLQWFGRGVLRCGGCSYVRGA
jgi:hypothetical protein